jgi:putative Holliday junction resolvase
MKEKFLTINQLREICKNNKKLLGIDWGEVYIGVAVSDSCGIVGSPLCTILCKKSKKKRKNEEIETFKEEIIQKIANLVNKESPIAVIIGLPLNMDGSFGAQANKVKIFAEQLSEHMEQPIFLQDERLSSKAIERILEPNLAHDKFKKFIDKLSAAFVLQGVIDLLNNTEF